MPKKRGHVCVTVIGWSHSAVNDRATVPTESSIHMALMFIDLPRVFSSLLLTDRKGLLEDSWLAITTVT